MRVILTRIVRLLRRILYRAEYVLIPLSERSADPDPLRQFRTWFDSAKRSGLYLHEGLALATADTAGVPSVRMVLLKQFDERGFVFYTNYNSRKSRELDANPRASLLFHWPEMHCQIRIDGVVDKISEEESDAYFHTRPRESQIGALASPQSEIIDGRDFLTRRVEELTHQYEGRPVPRPAHWGGYRLRAHAIEFWQGRAGRLHDRLLYERRDDGRWTMKRLAP